MTMQLKQYLNVSQQLILTPQLQQAIKLLQLSRMELVELIREEIRTNPVLEENEARINEPSEFDTKGDESGADPLYESGWDTYFEEYRDEYWYDKSRRLNPGKRDLPSFENITASKTNLYSHLMWQLSISNLDDKKKQIGVHIIGNLNKDGYLEASLEEISRITGASLEEVEETLHVIQNFDPVGVAARDIKECLLIQARSYNLRGTIVEKIILDHLLDVENKRYEKIAKELSVTLDDVLAAVLVIKSLDPRPGTAYFDEGPIYIVPDVYIIKVGDDYEVLLNQDDLPTLKINPYYKELLKKKKGLNKRERIYLREKFRSALWLIKSIYQRQSTIYKVTKSIVKFQRDFLEHGISHLKPLVLRDIAEDIEMSESTVSRITNNKYVHTPQGIFELKFFFSSAINGIGGESRSSTSVKEYIRKIIQHEDKGRPYTDQEIKEILEKRYCIKISRRTIAKYREGMGILSSKKRREIK
ncbi:MAG: RNA polymerase sigma-54 factor [Deltaproteobacteria bacterium]|nr:MAG: RNA polymerase sigma-54 factor [Deltaproteobacteria bacterium]